MMPRSGDVIYLGPGCGVPWNYLPTLFRVIRIVDQKSGWAGMAYIDGYQLDERGNAIEQRTVYVQVDGIRLVGTAAQERRKAAPTATIPRPRQPQNGAVHAGKVKSR